MLSEALSTIFRLFSTHSPPHPLFPTPSPSPLGHPEMVRLLMCYGANLNAADVTGHLPIDMTDVQQICHDILDESR